MRQIDGSDLVGVNDPRSQDIGIIYVTSNDEHKHVLAAILAQERLQHKQIVIVLPMQSGRSFRRLTDFEELKNMQRHLRAKVIFIADPHSSSAKFALQKGFGVYISLDRYKESLLANVNSQPQKTHAVQLNRNTPKKFTSNNITWPILGAFGTITLIAYIFFPGSSIYIFIIFLGISFSFLLVQVLDWFMIRDFPSIRSNKNQTSSSTIQPQITLAPAPISLQSVDYPPIVEAKPFPNTEIEPLVLEEREKSEAKAITSISTTTIEPPVESKTEQKLHIPHIFVSHSSKDDTFGLKLVQDLRHMLGEDEAVWYDAADGLQGGDHWWDRIKQELKARPIFIVIISPNAVASAWVQDEIRMAWRQKNSAAGKRIIPILYQLCDIPDDLDTLQIVSFLNCDTNSSKYQSALQALQKSLHLPGK